MKKIFGILFALALVLGFSLVAVPVAADDPHQNTVESSTMIFEGDLTDAGGGVYTGTIDMTEGEYYVAGGPGESISTGGGFDVYAEEGGCAYCLNYYGTGDWNCAGTDTYIVGNYTGTDHDAYPTPGGPWGSWYNPDCADWNQYSLELTADHWYLRYTSTGESPMSGVMYWYGDDTGYAAETDKGTLDDDDNGVVDGVYDLGGPAMWDWDAGAQVERIPLEYPGFAVEVTPGSYTVTLTPAEGPVKNLNTGVTYGTIQLAVDDASPGDTIEASAGTYNLAAPIVVDKALTLTGDTATPGNVVVNAPTGLIDMDCFQVKASGVTMQGFKMQGAKDADSLGAGYQNAAIMIGTHWDGPDIIGLQNINISYNEMTDCTKGIYVYRAQDVIISHNKIHDMVIAGDQASSVWPGKGIELRGDGDPTATQCSNIDILNNEIYNCELLGVEVNLWEMTPDEPFVDVDVLIQGNTIYDNGGNWAAVVGFDAYVYRGISCNGQATGVTINNNEIYGHNSESFTPHATSAAIRIDDEKEHTITDNYIHDNHKGIRISKADYSSLSGFVVSNNDFQRNTIQVDDAAVALDMQTVRDGNTFDRAVTVDHPGASLLHSIWSSIQDGIDAAVAGDTVEVADGTYYENVVIDKSLTLTAASTPVINGDTSGDGVPDGSCITINADGVTINGFELTNGYNGIIGETSGSTIENCIIHDNLNYGGSNGMGIALWGENDDNEILGNVIYDNDRQGIFIGYGDDTKISDGNTIVGNIIYSNGLYTQPNGPDASAYGIQLWNADGNTIAANEVYNHDDWFPYGTSFDFAQGIYLCASFDNTVVCNDLHDNNYGVGAWSAGRTPVGSNVINRNNIVNNTGYGVKNYDAVTIDARYNWWGDASGPGPVGPGSGDAVSDNVLFYPWLHEVADCGSPAYLLDHFKLYQVLGGAPVGAVVTLEDQFHGEPFAAMVESPLFFGNPAEKEHDGTVTEIQNFNDHLTLYGVTPLEEETQTWCVDVYNQFGSQNFTVSNPVMLAVPTRKAPHVPFVGPDHYLLYQVVDAEPFEVTVFLWDQFTGLEPKEEVLVLEPVYFANPVVETDGGGPTPIEDQYAHLVFYQILSAPYAGEVWIQNQFGMAILDLSNPSLLAVPSDKTFYEDLTCEAEGTFTSDRYQPGEWDYAISITRDCDGAFVSGTIELTAPDEGEVVAVIEAVKCDYAYWYNLPIVSKPNFAAVGTATYGAWTGNFMFLIADSHIWMALSTDDYSDEWAAETVWAKGLRAYDILADDGGFWVDCLCLTVECVTAGTFTSDRYQPGEWDYAISIKRSEAGDFVSGTIELTAPDLSKVVGVVEAVKCNYAYWYNLPIVSKPNFAAVGTATYGAWTGNFMFLIADSHIWMALSTDDYSDEWAAETVWAKGLRAYDILADDGGFWVDCLCA